MLPPSLYQAHVVLIPKLGKDLQSCSSYHPISLLNYDLEILSKIVATRLARVLPSLVDIGQRGFMHGKSKDIHLRRVLTHLQLPSATQTTRCVGHRKGI